MTHISKLIKTFRDARIQRQRAQREERIKKARTVKALRSSNLPTHIQRREIELLHRGKFSRFKEKFRPRKTTSKAYFGTEAENR